MPTLSVKRTASACCPRLLRPYWDRVATSPLGSRLARGAFWSLAGTAVAQGLMLLASIAVARILGRETFGQLGVIRSTVGMFGVLAGFGLGLTATKHVAEFRHEDPQRAGRVMILSKAVALTTGSLAALGLFVLAPWLAVNTLAAPEMVGPLRIGCLVLLLTTINSEQVGVLAGFEAFKSLARVGFFSGLASFGFLLSGAYWGGLEGTVWALVLTPAVSWALYQWAIRREARRAAIPFSWTGGLREWRLLWHFSIPAALCSSVVATVNWACAALLVNQPGGYGEMGIFNAANQWRMMILFIPSAVGQVLLPVLSNLNAEESRGEYRKALRYNLFLNTAIALVMALPVALAAPLIMAGYGREFASNSLALVWLASSAVPAALGSVIGHAIISKGKMWAGFLLNGFWAVCTLTLASLLVDRGASGVALAILLGYGIHALSTFLYVRLAFAKRVTMPRENCKSPWRREGRCDRPHAG